jgi:pimeloyl-ACP methyl ester carboxylesterase
MSHSTTLPSPTDLHDDQVIALLRSGAHATLLSAYFGATEYRELCTLAKLAATRFNRRGPLAFILPGIMGSRLAWMRRRSHNLLWLHPTAVANGAILQLALPGCRSVRALGVMLPGYLKLRLTLEIAGFRAVFHPFDWRSDLDRLARTFAQTIEKSGSRKVLVVAHSMGGLVARAALAHEGRRRIARIIQLGAPNAGSFAPMQALRAVYPTVRKIAALDQGNTPEDLARRVFLTLPGLYQMLPSRQHESHADFFDASSWPADDLRPGAALLARARRVRERMPAADERCCVIAGINQETIVSASLRDGEFHYEIRPHGDGTVPLSRARWDGARTWFADANHGQLTLNSTVLAAVSDLLKDGDTARLSAQVPQNESTNVRYVADSQLRLGATRKVHWDALSLDSRRRILEPVISPEFATPVS